MFALGSGCVDPDAEGPKLAARGPTPSISDNRGVSAGFGKCCCSNTTMKYKWSFASIIWLSLKNHSEQREQINAVLSGTSVFSRETAAVVLYHLISSNHSDHIHMNLMSYP